MRFSRMNTFIMYSFLIILNIILRIQIVPHEVGADSFGVHVLANSLSEFGYAKWILSPLSFFGLYPLSYSSAVQFFISGISQITGIEGETVIFLYCIIIGIISMFTAYVFASTLFPERDVLKLISALTFSTSPAILTYSTLSIPTRGLFIMLVPLSLYLLLNVLKSFKYAILSILLSVFLFATHHMFYFVIPSFIAFIAAYFIAKLIEKKLVGKKLEKVMPAMFILGFMIMFSIPFFTGKFLDVSRYSPIYISYTRYLGVLLPFGIGGLVFLVFKFENKITHLFLLLNSMFLTPFIYKQTYLKWYLPVLFSPLIGIGLSNLVNSSLNKRALILCIIITSSIIFSGYYQFLHKYDPAVNDERYLEDSTYLTGKWIKNNIQTSVMSNDELFAMRLLATTETIHQPTSSSINNFIYGFADVNLSSFKYYSADSEEFFYSTGEGVQDVGQDTWYNFNQQKINPLAFGIEYFVENTRSNGNIVWNHIGVPSKTLHKAYNDGNAVYDIGTAKIWTSS